MTASAPEARRGVVSAQKAGGRRQDGEHRPQPKEHAAADVAAADGKAPLFGRGGQGAVPGLGSARRDRNDVRRRADDGLVRDPADPNREAGEGEAYDVPQHGRTRRADFRGDVDGGDDQRREGDARLRRAVFRQNRGQRRDDGQTDQSSEK